MKNLRVLLLGLLCFAISIQGFARNGMAENPCPMLQSDAAATTMSAAADHDCCDDADAFAKTGKACKTGQECPAAGIALIPSVQTASFALVAPVRLVSRTPAMIDFAPPGVWRPPSSI